MLGQRRFIEILDGVVEQPVPVHLGAQPQEYATEANRGPVHHHELARRLDAAQTLEFLLLSLIINGHDCPQPMTQMQSHPETVHTLETCAQM